MKIELSPHMISVSIDGADPHLEAAGRVFYLYVHKDKAGNVFYVGKGRDRRAWSTERHPVWHHYVNSETDAKRRVTCSGATGLRTVARARLRWLYIPIYVSNLRSYFQYTITYCS